MAANFEQVIDQARSASSPLEARMIWSTFAPELQEHSNDVLRIALCGTFTTQPVEPYLGTELLRHGIAAEIRHSPYNQVYAELLSAASSLHTDPTPEVVVILWRMEELLAEALALLPSDPAAARQSARRELDDLLAAIRTFLDNANATVIVSNPTRPDPGPLALLDARLDQGVAALHTDVLTYWRSALGSEPRVHLLDLDGAQRDFGARQAANPRMWLLAKIPWSEGFSQEVGRKTARLVKSLRRPARKVLVLDCDNTLWGGIVGEDGPLALQVGEDAPGNAYAQLQRYALSLRQRGILLAVVSKNDEADVWGVFEKTPGMILKRDHIAAAQINWLPKSANLQRIAEDLNLGMDSLVFVDDNAAECAEVMANAPEVLTIHLDGDPAYNVRLIEQACGFDQLTLTEEDFQRAEMYTQERKRETLRGGVKTMEEYLAGLGLVLKIDRVKEEYFGRVTQLINKTNQFNLTTIRRTEAEVRALSKDPDWHLYAVWLKDRFGDYGLTGVAFCRDRGDQSEIDTLLLSCRVLGRGVERALAGVLIEQAHSRGKTAVLGRFIPTSKNSLAADYYPSQGFAETDGVFVYSTSRAFTLPSHITLDRQGLAEPCVVRGAREASSVTSDYAQLRQVISA
jgi:FkbH-like protein